MKPSYRLSVVRIAILVMLPCILVGCGTSYTAPPNPTTYTIGGMVSGLTGTGLVLQDNGGNNLTVTANGAFTFTTAVASGGAYAVTVFSQPSNPAQNCVVTSGSGNASANVTNVQVTCTTVTPTFTIGVTVVNLVGSGLVLQDNGVDNLPVAANGSFTFATGVAAGGPYAVTVSTEPSTPARFCGVVNGSGTANAVVTNVVVNCGLGEWAWISGTNMANQNGAYGAQGTPATNNAPGARNFGAFGWADKSGNFWLFGGNGFDSVGTNSANGGGELNDLWEYSVSNNTWTWVSGLNTIGQAGTPPAASDPGARDSGASWVDASGNLWLFGGNGFDSTGTLGLLNDLWKFDISTRKWTQVSSSSTANQKGTYGMQGVAATTNVPGGRNFVAANWTDGSGNLWLLGGKGLDSTGTAGELNDLWEYNISNKTWAWVSGSKTIGQAGTPPPANAPGARDSGVGLVDASGNLWLFGGNGFDSTGTLGLLNDLWKFNIGSGQWTQVSSSSTANQNGTYGTQGVATTTNVPGARSNAYSWMDSSGNFWVFGGFGFDSAGNNNDMNDLWEYSVTTGEWAWINGPNLANQPIVGTPTLQGESYGTEGISALGNIPGDREAGVNWIDSSGNLWLFGGTGINDANDLWMYVP